MSPAGPGPPAGKSAAGSPAWGRRSPGGDRVRRACYGPAGLAAQLAANVAMVLATTFILVWDLAVLRMQKPPLWFVLLDCAVVLFLVVEVVVRTLERGGCGAYLARPANRFDLAVAVLSVAGLGLYVLEASRYSDDAETAVFVFRVARDTVRFGRVLFFARVLRESLVEFRGDGDELPEEVRELMITPAASPIFYMGGRNFVAQGRSPARRPSARAAEQPGACPPHPEDVL